MSYKLHFSKDVQRSLRKMDKHQSALIVRWLYLHVDGIEDPRSIGKGLTANRSGQWRYRVGNYRVICDIKDDELIVETINVGHRRNIYD